jgi:predicted Co/Zn/Cd cation transporter (cation efflux family)
MTIEIPDKKGLRDFGLITGSLFIVFFGLLLPWLFSLAFPLWPWIVAGVLSVLALIAPNGLKFIYQGWMFLALILAWINTRLILGIVFYLLITPMGSIMRLFGKNAMKNKPSQSETYRSLTTPRSPKQMEHPF